MASSICHTYLNDARKKLNHQNSRPHRAEVHRNPCADFHKYLVIELLANISWLIKILVKCTVFTY